MTGAKRLVCSTANRASSRSKSVSRSLGWDRTQTSEIFGNTKIYPRLPILCPPMLANTARFFSSSAKAGRFASCCSCILPHVADTKERGGRQMAARNEVPLEPDIKHLFAEYGRTLILMPSDADDPEMLFERVCAEFENVKIEQDEEGNIYIMAPAGAESSDRNTELTMQLRLWAKQDGRGRAFGPDVEFIFPNHSKRGPDAAWIRNEKLIALSRNERRKFAHVIPDFVVELKSPSDRISKLQEKMIEYRRNGVELGWLIDPDQRTVSIYRAREEAAEVFQGERLPADGPVAGFVLDLAPIWQGLEF